MLNAGAPTVTKKVKGQEITNVLTPLKPSRSPWLSRTESKELAALFKPTWEAESEMRTVWNALSPEEQHTNYKATVSAIKKHFEELKTISSSVHARLGHRKKWIYAAAKHAGVDPKSKKDKANPFAWTAAFFKLDLTKAGTALAMTFSPAHFLVEKGYDAHAAVTLAWQKALKGSTDLSDELASLDAGPMKNLLLFWAIKFSPNTSIDINKVPESSGLKDDNPFVALPEVFADSEEEEEEEDA